MRKKAIALVWLLLAGSAVIAAPAKVDSLKQALNSERDNKKKVVILFSIFDHYRYTHPDSSLTYIQQALEIAEKDEDWHNTALARLFLCETFSMLGNDPLALNYGFKALVLFEELKDTMGICNTSTSIGNFYSGQGDYEKSLFYYHKALNLLEDYSDQSSVHYFWGGISGIFLQKNQLDSALYFATKAYEKDPEWTYGLRLMASIYSRTGNNQKAFEFYRKATTSAITNRFQSDLIEIYTGIAKLHRLENNNDSALIYASKALAEVKEHSYPAGILELTLMLGDIYETKNQKDSALKYMRMSLDIKDELYNSEKIRAFQNISFNEELKLKELEATRAESRRMLILYLLLGGMIVAVVIAVILLRNNRQKEKANRELEITQTQLIQSEKMASLGELTAGIAHEIQNPLNFVTNFSEVSSELLDEIKTAIDNEDKKEALAITSEVKQNLERIKHHGLRAGAIVKGMLYHSRSSSGKKEPTDINALADEYLRLTYHGLRAKDKSFNASMKSDFDQTIGEINIMPQEIGRVLLNLLSNAFYAVNEKKKLNLNGYLPSISVSTKNLGKNIEIRIIDNGIGIPKSVMEKIFQPFFTTKPTGEGTGLGLSLSYDIITKGHGGKLTVETKEGEGTRFIIILPRQ